MTHVFVVNYNTFKFHLEYMFAGTGAGDDQLPFMFNPNMILSRSETAKERKLVGMISDISRIRIGDNVIFYVQAHDGIDGSFYGVFKVASEPFLDENDDENYLWEQLEKGLTFRVLLEPAEVFQNGVTEHEYLDNLEGIEHPYEMCWSLIYRKLRANRGCTMIFDYEYQRLYTKLKQANKNHSLPGNSFSFNSADGIIVSAAHTHRYKGRKNDLTIENRLIFKAARGNAFETHLQALVLQKFDKSLKSLLLKWPEKEAWIGNEVSCGVGMQRIDILIIQQSKNEVFIRIVELKDEAPYKDIIDYQLPWYLEWLTDYVVPNLEKLGKQLVIRPCILAANTDNEDILEYIKATPLLSSNKKIVVEATEYISFELSEDEVAFNKVI